MTDLHALANAISTSSPAIRKFAQAVADVLQPVPPPPGKLVVGSNIYPGEEQAAALFSKAVRMDRGTPPAGFTICGLLGGLDATSPYAMSPFVEVDNEPYFQGVDTSVWAVKARDCAKAVRSRNPGAKILLPLLCQVNNGDYNQGGTWTPWVTLLWRAVPDLHTYFDGYALHPYSGAGSAPWTGSATASTVDHVRSQLKAIPGADKPFYLTEMGWDTNKVSAAQQAQYLGDQLAWAAARSDVAAAYIFALEDGHDGNYGIVGKPSYQVAKGYAQ